MRAQDQWLCLWSGPVFIALLFIFFWGCAGFIPPPAPTLSADEVVAFYNANLGRIRLGLAMSLLASGLLVPFTAVITTQMRRISGIGPTLAYTQLGAGSVNVMVFVLPYLIFAAASFRPQRSPELTLLLHEFGWLSFIMAVPLAIIQVFAFGAAVLMDKSAAPIYPRWSAYLSLWTGFLFVPASITLFFKQGPFAWNGLFAIWIPLAVFTAWFVALFVLTAKAIRRQEREGQVP